MNLRKIHQNELLNFLSHRYTSSDNPKCIFYGANDGYTDETQQDGIDPIFNFLKNHPWFDCVFLEPIPSIFNKLKNNYKFHSNQFTFLCAGVSKEGGNASLNIFGRDGRASSVVYDKVAQEQFTKHNFNDQEKFRIQSGLSENGSINIKLLKHSEVIKICNLSKVNFIKIDIEGLDLDVVIDILDSTQDIFLPDVIYFETHKELTKDHIVFFDKYKYLTLKSGLNVNGGWSDTVLINKNILKNHFRRPQLTQ